MRLIFHSAPPNIGTGYGAQTSMLVPRLQAMGHDVAISATAGLYGAITGADGPRGIIPIFPPGRDKYSNDVLPGHTKKWDADAVITLFDAWVFKQEAFTVPWIAYFPVDQEYMPAPDLLKRASVRVVMTRFGEAECDRYELSSYYAPHCYDAAAYAPRPPETADIHEPDKFVVGMVARNGAMNYASPPRKSFAQCMEGFAMFHEKYPDSELYIHANSTTTDGGIDLQALRGFLQKEYPRLDEDSVTFPHPYILDIGEITPPQMSCIYSAMDVLLSPTMGEGFGVPILEAQACGTPVIVGDWTGMAEVCHTGTRIPKDEAFRYTTGTGHMGWQYLVKPDAVCRALEDAYENWRYTPGEVAAKVKHYEANKVINECWPPILAEAEKQLGVPKPALNRAQRRSQKRKTAA